MATSFTLIRHGESQWNAQGRWQGQGDPPLTEHGRDQVRRAAKAWLEGREHSPIDIIVSSDLKRAAESARIFGEALGLEPQLDARLRELDVGEWSGLSHEEISQRWPADYAAFRAGDTQVCLGGAESWAMLTLRFRKALGELALGNDGKELMIVAHGGAIRSVVPGLHLGNAQSHSVVLSEELAAAWARGDVESDVESDSLTDGAGSAQATQDGEAL
jgi:broad specificity phosphatase PhoE